MKLKFGKLKIMPAYKKKNERIHWLCKCDCGNFTFVPYYKLASNHTTSCGCNQHKCIPVKNIVDKFYIFFILIICMEVELNN